MPVAARMALAIAGMTGGSAGSPSPVGGKSLFTQVIATSRGTASMRSSGKSPKLSAVIAPALEAHRGSHASPRWRIRRGHWRMLQDGRRVFVRECRVGDASRGGVVKDYHMQLGAAA